MLGVGRDGNERVAKGNCSELERLPVQIGRERIGNLNDLGRGCRVGLVLKRDFVGEQVAFNHKILHRETSWAGELVWITWNDTVAGGAAAEIRASRTNKLTIGALQLEVVTVVIVVVGSPRTVCWRWHVVAHQFYGICNDNSDNQAGQEARNSLKKQKITNLSSDDSGHPEARGTPPIEKPSGINIYQRIIEHVPIQILVAAREADSR